MSPDLNSEVIAALLAELDRIIDGDRFSLPRPISAAFGKDSGRARGTLKP